MISLRRITGILSLLNSLLAIYAYFAGYAGSYSIAMLVLGTLLLLVSLVCIYGVLYAFYGSAVLSTLVLIISLLVGGTSLYFVLLDAVSLASLTASAITLRRGSKLPEQAHPLNLPVFG